MDKNFSRAFGSLYTIDFRLQRKSTFWWLIVLAVLFIITLSMYPLMDVMMGGVSQQVLEQMQMNGLSLQFDNITQYLIIESVQLVSMAGALFIACYIAQILSKDFKYGQYELLYTNALSRQNIIMAKFLNVITMVFIFNIMMLIIEFAVMSIVDFGGIKIEPIFAMFLYNIILHLIFATLIFGVYLMKKKSGIGMAIAIPLVFYFIVALGSSLSGVAGDVFLYLSPYSPLFEIKLDNSFVVNCYPFLIWAIVAIGTFIFGLNRFKNRDF